jgi:hypothetical protein
MAPALFAFVQFEFPWALGPADGRYVVRPSAGADPERVVVLATLGARRRRRSARSSRRARPAPEPEPVSVSRATVIDTAPLADERAASAWLSGAERGGEAQAALVVLDRLLFAQRIATADPYLHEISTHQALTLRVGWGEGEQVADGRWREARELAVEPARRGRRSAVLRPQERLAILLGARGRALLGEELALRARQDIDHARTAHAAVELGAAYATLLPALVAEGRAELAGRLRELAELAPAVQAAARRVLDGAGDDADPAATEHALGRLEAALRARAAAGFPDASP